ncbi:hypothetical protein KIN20_030005, partial [Parelaphostrongylus tenuis]
MGRRCYSQPEIHLSYSANTNATDRDQDCKSEGAISKEPYCFTIQQYARSQRALSEGIPSPTTRRYGAFSITRYDPCTTEERMKSIQSLLAQIYDEHTPSESSRDLPYSPTDSVPSDYSCSSRGKISAEKLQTLDVAQLRNELTTLNNEIIKANQRLVKMVRQKAFHRAKQATKCAMLSAILMATSQKTSTDSKLRFSLEPLSNNDGVEQWKRSMRAMSRLPGGVPGFIRIKLWSTMADLYIRSKGFEWKQIRRNTLSEKVQPDDNKIHSQILKDLNRTGWNEFDDEKKLKQVLLGFNKDIGYCQGFNVIAALILQVVEYRTDIALKIMIFLIECVLPRGYFDQSLGALSVDLIVMRDLMLQRLPAVVHHLEQLQSSSIACSNHRSSIHDNSNEYEPPLTNLFPMHWFLTLFTTCLPRNCVMRVWDALMLNGSEILIRTAIALWSKISSKILHTSSADEFYALMKNLCKDLMKMNEQQQDRLIKVIHSMEEFPYPGLAELREKHTWNIQPLSMPNKSFRKSVSSILYDDPSDEESACISCHARLRRRRLTWNDLRLLQKQYHVKQQKQKHASVLLTLAYRNTQNTLTNVAKLTSMAYPLSFSSPVFNHLLLGPILARDESKSELPTAVSGGVAQLAASVIQPYDSGSRMIQDGTVNMYTAIGYADIQEFSKDLSIQTKSKIRPENHIRDDENDPTTTRCINASKPE